MSETLPAADDSVGARALLEENGTVATIVAATRGARHDQQRAEAAEALAADAQSVRDRMAIAASRGDPRGRSSPLRAACTRSLATWPQAAALLRCLVQDDDPAVRAAAVAAGVGDLPLAPALERALDDPAPAVRTAAVGALAATVAGRRAVLRWYENGGLDDPSLAMHPSSVVVDLRRAVIRAIAGEPEMRPRLPALAAEPAVSGVVVDALVEAEHGRAVSTRILDDDRADEAARVAMLDIDDREAPVRREAMAALARDAAGVGVVRARLWPERRGVRRAAFRLLLECEHAGPATGAAAELLELLDGDDALVRADALHALATDDALRPHVTALALAGDAAALGALGAAGAPLGTEFHALLDHRAGETRLGAARLLRDEPKARARMKRLLKDRDASVRAVAAEAFAGDLRERPSLRRLLSTKQPAGDPARAAAGRALRDDPESQELFEAFVVEDEEDEVLMALALAALHDPPQDVDIVWEKLDDIDEWPEVRVEALGALSRWGTPIERLRRFLEDPMPQLRARAVEVVADDSTSRTSIRARLRDESSFVREAAARALRARAIRGDTTPSTDLRALEPPELPPAKQIGQLEDGASSALGNLSDDDLVAWLRARLVRRADGTHCEAYVAERGAQVLVTVRADAAVLRARERMYPLHNLIEAHQAAGALALRAQTSVWLICSEAPLADVVVPDLAPGRMYPGPGVYGLALRVR